MQIDCKAGSPCPHKPTALTRELVKNLYAVGISIEKIANRMRIDAETVRKHYKEELDEALQNMNIIAMNRLYERVENGDYKSIMSWLKCRAGWKEASNDEENKNEVAEYLLDQLRKKDTNAE